MNNYLGAKNLDRRKRLLNKVEDVYARLGQSILSELREVYGSGDGERKFSDRLRQALGSSEESP